MFRLVLSLVVLAVAAAAPYHDHDKPRSSLQANRLAVAPLRVGSKRYFLQTVKSNWYRANEFCNYQGMRLATISSQEENDKVAKYIRNSGLGGEYFWIGASDLGERGKYVWMSTGEPLEYTNWLAGEPNHLTDNGEVEHCVHLFDQNLDFTWNDKICSIYYNFICEM